MKRWTCIALAAVCTVCAAVTYGDGLAPDEEAFLDKHIADVVKVDPSRITDPAVVKAFGAPLYELKITITSGEGGSMDQKQIVAHLDDKLVAVGRPSSDADFPLLAKMIKADFTLKTDADAKTLQDAMNVVFETFSDDDKKAVAFTHSGKEWTFIRGKFFDKKMGFVLTTDDKGKVTGAKFSLKL